MRTQEQKADQLIKDGELRKARIHQTRGNKLHHNFNFDCEDLLRDEDHEYSGSNRYELDLSREFVHSAMVDESYHLVGSHVDESTQEKIVNGEYVDFARLVPRDRIMLADDQRYEMIVKDGKTFWMPANVHEGVSISNYGRWEQAFRVFSKIYMKAHPYRATELVQYNHLIHLASQTYVWENVYLYDKDFRIHMSNHPRRSWSIILQQAWTVRLREKVKPHSHGEGEKKADLCKMLNKTGKCSFGASCKFEHRCSYCFKFGHGAYNCQKLRAETGRHGQSRGYYDDRRDRRSRSRDRFSKRYGNENYNNNNGNHQSKKTSGGKSK